MIQCIWKLIFSPQWCVLRKFVAVLLKRFSFSFHCVCSVICLDLVCISVVYTEVSYLSICFWLYMETPLKEHKMKDRCFVFHSSFLLYFLTRQTIYFMDLSDSPLHLPYLADQSHCVLLSLWSPVTTQRCILNYEYIICWEIISKDWSFLSSDSAVCFLHILTWQPWENSGKFFKSHESRKKKIKKTQ